jgi:hypothetical protein
MMSLPVEVALFHSSHHPTGFGTYTDYCSFGVLPGEVKLREHKTNPLSPSCTKI